MITRCIWQVYNGLSYKLVLDFPNGYPYKAPTVKFETPCYHPNVDGSGNICLDILKEKWSALYDVRTILLSIQSLLGGDNFTSIYEMLFFLMSGESQCFGKVSQKQLICGMSSVSKPRPGFCWFAYSASQDLLAVFKGPALTVCIGFYVYIAMFIVLWRTCENMALHCVGNWTVSNCIQGSDTAGSTRDTALVDTRANFGLKLV